MSENCFGAIGLESQSTQRVQKETAECGVASACEAPQVQGSFKFRETISIMFNALKRVYAVRSGFAPLN